MSTLFDTKRFRAGEEFEVGHGIHVRTVDGSKFEGDVRWEILVPSGWQPIPFKLVYLLVDGFYENEGCRYPVTEGKRGGSAFIQSVRRVVDIGYEAVVEQLECDKERRRKRG